MGTALLFGVDFLCISVLLLDTPLGLFYDLRVDAAKDFLALGGATHRGRVAVGVAKARGNWDFSYSTCHTPVYNGGWFLLVA